MPEEKDESLTLDKRTMDVLVAHVIPTSKYFEARFDHMQDQIDRINTDLRDFRGDVDKRFEQVIASIDRLADKLDHRDERQRTFIPCACSLLPSVYRSWGHWECF